MVKWNGISLVGCESQQHKNIFHKLENDCCCCCCWPNCCVFHQTEYEQASERANERPKTNFNKIQCKLRQKHYVVHVNFVYVILYAWRRPLYLFIYLFPHTHTHTNEFVIIVFGAYKSAQCQFQFQFHFCCWMLRTIYFLVDVNGTITATAGVGAECREISFSISKCGRERERLNSICRCLCDEICIKHSLDYKHIWIIHP